jgi:hypothetical protein
MLMHASDKAKLAKIPNDGKRQRCRHFDPPSLHSPGIRGLHLTVLHQSEGVVAGPRGQRP